MRADARSAGAGTAWPTKVSIDDALVQWLETPPAQRDPACDHHSPSWIPARFGVTAPAPACGMFQMARHSSSPGPAPVVAHL